MFCCAVQGSRETQVTELVTWWKGPLVREGATLVRPSSFQHDGHWIEVSDVLLSPRSKHCPIWVGRRGSEEGQELTRKELH